MPFFVDQLGRKVEINTPPGKIVSLVPSQTELLYDLGLNEEVAGITKFCIHPAHWFKTKTRVGGTKQLHIDKIRELQPELIIANKEENVKEQIETLAKDFPVWVSDVNTLEEACEMINALSVITACAPQAQGMITDIRYKFSELRPCGISVAYLIWKDPYMTIGGDTFISSMLNWAGFINVFEKHKRYPEITMEQLQSSGYQILFLSSEPYPFHQKHIDELQPFFPKAKIILVDGEMFSWYGSRLLKAPSYFQQLQNQVLSLTHARRTE